MVGGGGIKIMIKGGEGGGVWEGERDLFRPPPTGGRYCSYIYIYKFNYIKTV